MNAGRIDMTTHPEGGRIRAAARSILALLAPLALLALVGCSNAPGKESAGGPGPSPLLYEIASADGAVEGWMVGTIHALPSGTSWRTPALDDVVKRADLLVVEIGRQTGPDSGPALYHSLAQSPDLPPLAERLPAELRPTLAAMMRRGGIAPSDLMGYETWAAAITLARVDATGDPVNGVDRALLDKFADRRVRELEGMRAQLSIFDQLGETEQRAMLTAVVRESERARADPERLQRAWLAGDAQTIQQATHEGILADPALREALLVARNRRWSGTIGAILAQPPRPLIAVGAAHLVGPDGLVVLLEAEGYRVRRLR